MPQPVPLRAPLRVEGDLRETQRLISGHNGQYSNTYHVIGNVSQELNGVLVGVLVPGKRGRYGLSDLPAGLSINISPSAVERPKRARQKNEQVQVIYFKLNRDPSRISAAASLTTSCDSQFCAWPSISTHAAMTFKIYCMLPMPLCCHPHPKVPRLSTEGLLSGEVDC